ncbi:Na(+)/H(+) antiporter subunit C1 [Cupriavidus yeoncheonensis]|uniref:Na(+)/H(+) antiporter subunit C1 n=1 Tax=Cupriavidus yeoncheonensis TaxID=1462994 RepID=A0A916MYF8_9BURK|nr:Na+/H+ antiporter subunit C [Cupriavidus yeoncheonensis]CAG2157793.1 Na(+)/H(+) antiporter subunit C1 [Cupriavidus yeoncheonensis]
MAALYAGAIGVLAACGIYLLLRARTFTVVLGLTLLSYAISLFLLGMGRLAVGRPPVIADGAHYGAHYGAQYADPLPQALVLTAIVIAFGMTAFAVVLSLRSLGLTGSDHVDAASQAGGDDADCAQATEPRP